ncbi:tetratricopeptide repeat protein [Nitratidesulfovibrio liaohensis]|uniref:Tetratricopeptide repeat protein n=1 Tax=Nitratidesulfovibrio liaohensis TaxID=2604158 RepID=A0ABY9R1P1_9BACT|nr:tetratricopeptide repeat protein [Nitratidesulfovibrio liaohensis]WMW65067.1 tetratricopeptide repeat protein [Nitratidesulfovibrio liaohensis]
MTARTATRPALALLALCALLLAGCGAQQTTRGSNLSLMERYHSGKDLLHDGEGVEPTPQADAMNAQEHLQRGLVFLSQDRSELAFEQFSRACQLDPKLAEARYQRGALLVARGVTAEARVDIDAALSPAPDNARAWETAGMLSFAEGNLTEAGSRFERALALDPRLVGAASHLGAIHNYQGQPDKALAVYLRALEQMPRSGDLHNNAGIAQAMLGNDTAAVDHFRAAITYGAPGNRVWNNMGLSLCRLGRYDEAFEAFRNAGGEAAAHNNLGVYLSQQGEHALGPVPPATRPGSGAALLRPRGGKPEAGPPRRTHRAGAGSGCDHRRAAAHGRSPARGRRRSWRGRHGRHPGRTRCRHPGDTAAFVHPAEGPHQPGCRARRRTARRQVAAERDFGRVTRRARPLSVGGTADGVRRGAAHRKE